MTDYLKIGQRVFTAPQGDAPVLEAATVTKEAVLGEKPARPTGEIRGMQDLEPPVSYLVSLDDGGAEWLSADNVEVIAEEDEGEGDDDKAAA